MASEIAALEGEVKEYREQLDVVLEQLRANPDNAELQSMKSEIDDIISMTETSIAELKANLAPAPSKPDEPEEKPKWSKEKHPAFQPGFRKPGAPPSPTEPEAHVYKVNDMVLAKWKSGDKAFYPARITSITGSSASPVYYVTFKNYGNTETLRGGDIKPISNNATKRKADGTPVASPSPVPAPPANPGVISAAADINPELASQAKKEPSKVSDGPPRPAKIPRKVKANKELEAGKSAWQQWSSSTKGKLGKAAKKDSMFRTGEGVNARVGFTGSGQAMRKDPARSRHVYGQDSNEDY